MEFVFSSSSFSDKIESARRVLTGNLLIFTLGDAVRHLSMFITFPYFSLYIQALGGSMIDIGVVNSLRPLAALFMYPIAGYLADRYSRVKIIAVSGYINAALYLIFALSPDWRFLALGNFLQGFMVFQFPAMNALMADSLPSKKRGIGYSLWIAIPSGVGILSPYIGAYLITLLGVDQAMRLLYWWTVATTTGIATMNLKFLKETRPQRSIMPSETRLTKVLA
jgi:MFS family permease